MSKYSNILASALVGWTGVIAGSAHADVDADITATLQVYQWINPVMIESTDTAIARFKERFPNVTIDAQFVPQPSWGEYITGLLNQSATGQTPDIIASAIEGFAEISSSGIVRDLSEVIAADPNAQSVLSEIDPNLLDGIRTRPDGNLNFFPTQWNNIVVYYNMDLFDEAGIAYPADDWTWTEFRETAAALTKSDANGTTTQYGYAVPGFNFGLQPWFLTNNTNILDADWRESTVDDPKFRESLELLHALIHEDGSAPAFELGVHDDKFVAGQVAMFSAGRWPAPSIVEAGMENVGIQIMPIGEVEATVFGIGGLAISSQSEHPELAWEFVKEMTGETYQQEMADGGRSIPSWGRFASTDEWTAFPENGELFYETASTAQAVVSPPNFSQVGEIVMRHVGAYLTDNQDIDTTIEEMHSELERSMSRAYR